MTVFRAPTDFVPIWKARAAELELSYEQIDMLSGMPDGYFGKVICGMKNPGTKAIEFYNGTLALKFVPTQDDEQAERMRGRWTKRKRPLQAAAVSINHSLVKMPENIEEMMREALRNHMREIGAKGNKSGAASKGGKRRARTMKKRARQQAASHAARIRWSRTIAER